MKFVLLTYNINFNQALAKLPLLLDELKPDIVTLQELNTLDDSIAFVEKCGYTLADFSHSMSRRNSLFGIATFYKKDTFTMNKSSTITLPFGAKEVIDFIIRRTFQKRTVLRTEFTSVKGQLLTIYNMQLSAYAGNGLRMRQLRKTLQTLGSLENPIIIVGDLNFPVGRKAFEEEFHKYGFKEATYKIFDTFRSNIRIFPFSLKLDYVLYKNMKQISTLKVPVRYSDHFPLLTSCEI